MRTRLAGLLACLALLATACGISTPTSDLSLSEEPVTLRFAWWGADARHQRTQQLIDAFEARHPHVTIEGEYSDWTGYWNRLATTFAADDAPDIVQMDELYLRTYADRGALFDLGALSQYLDTSRFSEPTLASGRAEGRQYALPVGIGAQSIVADVGVFEQYGIALPDDETWTWDEFREVARTVTERSGGAVFGFGGSGGDPASLTAWARQHGHTLYDDRGRVVMPPETLASWWGLMGELEAEGATPPASVQVEQQSATLDQGGLVTGLVAMAGYYNTQIGALRKAMPDARLALLEYPRTPGGPSAGTYYKPSMYWSIAAGTDHPAEAALFVDFLANDAEAARILGTERGIPANPDVVDALRPSFSPADAAASAYNDDLADTAGQPPALTPPGAGGIEPIMRRYLTDVLFDRQTPEGAARAFLEELTLGVETARS